MFLRKDSTWPKLPIISKISYKKLRFPLGPPSRDTDSWLTGIGCKTLKSHPHFNETVNEERWAYRCGCVTEARQTAFSHLPNRPRQNEHYPSEVATSRRMHSPFIWTLPHSMFQRTKNPLSIVHKWGICLVCPASFKLGCDLTIQAVSHTLFNIESLPHTFLTNFEPLYKNMYHIGPSSGAVSCYMLRLETQEETPVSWCIIKLVVLAYQLTKQLKPKWRVFFFNLCSGFTLSWKFSKHFAFELWS